MSHPLPRRRLRVASKPTQHRSAQNDGPHSAERAHAAAADRWRALLADAWTLIRQTVAEWNEDGAARLAAALAYYTIFSLAPILVIAIGVAGIVFGRDAAQGQIVGQIEVLVGRDGARAVQELIQNASRPEPSALASVLGFVALLFATFKLRCPATTACGSASTFWSVSASRPYCSP
jgi:Virulence factor BrkB